jgi:hypothetical protein
MKKLSLNDKHISGSDEFESELTDVFPDDPRAAKRVVLVAWIPRRGYPAHVALAESDEKLAEEMARREGATTLHCERCGKSAGGHNQYCPDCRSAVDREKWEKLPLAKWDGQTPLALYNSDDYFFSEDALEEFCEEHDCQPSDLMLVICESCKPAADVVDGDTFVAYLGEDQDLDDDVVSAIVALQKAIDKSPQSSWAWTAGYTRPSDFYAELEREG